MKRKPQVTDNLEINESTDGYVIYDPTRDKVHFLNHTAAIILELCNGDNSVEEIIELLSKAYNVPELPIAEIQTYIDNLYKEGLLQ